VVADWLPAAPVFAEYGGRRYANHVGDDSFVVIYIINALAIAALAAALLVFWKPHPRWRMAAVLTGTCNLGACLTFFVMHRVGALVEYGEFIRHMKGGM
jgi:hypothetical protein